MPIDVDTMVTNVWNSLGVDGNDVGFGTTQTLLLLNQSFWEILNKFEFREKETSYNFSTIAGQSDYVPPTIFEALKLISIEDPNDLKHTPLDRMSPLIYEQNFVNLPTSQTKPTNYLRYNNLIRLFPTPDIAYNLTVYHWLTLSDLVTHGTLGLPREWDELVQDGAIYRGYKILGDLVKAKQVRQDQIERINSTVPVESKEENDSPNSGVNIPAGITVLGYGAGDY